MRKQKIGLRAEKRLATFLSGFYGRVISRASYASPFDLLIDGHRAEVKCAALQKKGKHRTWKFNIHRHGVLSEQQTDFYILRLEGVPYSKYAIHMLLRSPIRRKVVEISVRALLNQRFASAVDDFYALAKGKYQP